MELKITASRHAPEVNIAAMSGRLDVETADRTLPELLGLIAQSSGGVIIDLKEVTFVSSAGLRTLLSACKKADAEGKNLAMIQAQPQVYKIFKVAAFDTLFTICKNEKEALKSFAAAAK